MSLIAELKRRNVFRVGAAYAIVGWLLIEVAHTAFPTLQLPGWTTTLVTVLLLMGFPVALVIAWAFEMTPEGIKREDAVERAESIRVQTGRRLNFTIVGLLALAVVYFAVDKFVLEVEPEQAVVTAKRVPAREKSIAGQGFVSRSTIALPEHAPLMAEIPFKLVKSNVSLAISPDGRTLVYVADIGDTGQLYRRQIDSFSVEAIPGSENAYDPFFSPDGKWVGFFADDSLKKVSLMGGAPVTLCKTTNPTGAAWVDGVIYFGSDEGFRLYRVEANGGLPELVSTGPVSHVFNRWISPSLLPDSRGVIGFSSLTGSTDDLGFMVLSLPEANHMTTLSGEGIVPRYVATGHLLFAKGGNIFAAPFDLEQLSIIEEAVPVLAGVRMNSDRGTAQFAVSRTGTLIYAPGEDSGGVVPAWVRPSGDVEPLLDSTRKFGTFDVSPDGKRLAIEVFGVETQIYIIDIAEGSLSKLTVEGTNQSPRWTPDGSQIAFSSSRRGKSGIYMKHVDRHRDADLLSEVNGSPSSWSPDGTVLAYTDFTGTVEGGIWFLDRDGSRTLFLETPFTPWGPAFSPDGRWIAYTSSRSGQYQVYVRPYSPDDPEEDRVWQISQGFGEEPVWSPLGDKLFYRHGDQWMSVSVSTEPEFVAHPPEPAFSGNYRNVGGRSYDISPDGERFLVLVPDQRSANVTQIRVVQNWFEELKSRVPLGGN